MLRFLIHPELILDSMKDMDLHVFFYMLLVNIQKVLAEDAMPPMYSFSHIC